MSKSRARGRQRRERLSLQDKGYQLCAFGVAAVVVPLLVGSSPMLAGLSAAVGPIGWMALAGGLAMLGLHRLQAAKSPANDPTSPDAANAPRSAKPRATPTPVSVTAPAHPATWRIARLMRLGRSCPDLDAQLMFEPDEWKAAYILNQKKLPDKPPTLNEVVRLVARLGGFLTRKGDGEPGVKTIWLGMQRILDFAAGIRFSRELQAQGTCV